MKRKLLLTSAQWSYKFVKHAFKVEKLLFIQVTSTFTTYKALFGEHGTSVQTQICSVDVSEYPIFC